MFMYNNIYIDNVYVNIYLLVQYIRQYRKVIIELMVEM